MTKWREETPEALDKLVFTQARLLDMMRSLVGELGLGDLLLGGLVVAHTHLQVLVHLART